MKQKRAIEILVDDRERGVLNEELEKLGLVVKNERLKTGDYVSGDICFERKTIDDLCASIMDGRIENQIACMKQQFKHNFVLISGRIKDKTSEMDENCILGKIVSLIVKHGVPVIMVDDEEQMAFVIKRICERLLVE